MNKSCFFLPVSLLSLLVVVPVVAADNQNNKNAVNSDIPSLNEIELPTTNAELLTQQPAVNEVKQEPTPEPDLNPTNDPDISIETIGEKDILPESTPTYVIEKAEIQKQGATSVADVLKKMPGFAINDVEITVGVVNTVTQLATDINALAVTKLDGTAKGGVVIGISDQMKIPVKYIGVGEGMMDLQLFDKKDFVDSLFND
jgi:hypothetical protein